MDAVFRSPAPAEGVHDLRPVGPWPLPGTVAAKNGRVPGAWACLRCGRCEGDSSRAKELARSPCGGVAWQLAAAKHSLVLEGSMWRCTRCLLQARPQHSAQTERQACPVGECTLGGGRWLPGEAGMRELFGRLRAFRHFCTPGEEDEPPEQKRRVDEGPQQPGTDTGSGSGAAAGQGGTAFGGSAASTASGSGAAGSGHGIAADRANPLAVAGGAQERRNLKQGGLPEAEGPEVKPAGSEASANAEPPRFSLQAYEGHAVAFVGRNLWCLKCFEVPRSAHRSWKHGRCGGVRPPTAMPPALRDGMLRQSAACPKLYASTRARWAVLAGALGLQ